MPLSFSTLGQAGTALLLITTGLILGTAMRSRLVFAGGGECTPNIERAEFVEVRRAKGEGAVEEQQMFWRMYLQLVGLSTVEDMYIFATTPGEPDLIEFPLEPEEAP